MKGVMRYINGNADTGTKILSMIRAVLLYILLTAFMPAARAQPPAQDTGSKPAALPEPEIYTKAETDPVFKGNFRKFISKNLVYPQKAVNERISGTVIIQFIVDKEGKVYQIKMDDKSPQKNQLLVEEAKRIIALSSGRWKPATQNGKLVQCYQTQRISFILRFM